VIQKWFLFIVVTDCTMEKPESGQALKLVILFFTSKPESYLVLLLGSFIVPNRD